MIYNVRSHESYVYHYTSAKTAAKFFEIKR